MLTADAIRNLDDKQIEKVSVPEWKGFVYIRTFTAGVRESMSTEAKGERKNTVARFAAASLCDESGNLLYVKPEDIEMLSKKSSSAMERIFNAVLKLNAVGEEATEAERKN